MQNFVAVFVDCKSVFVQEKIAAHLQHMQPGIAADERINIIFTAMRERAPILLRINTGSII